MHSKNQVQGSKKGKLLVMSSTYGTPGGPKKPTKPNHLLATIASLIILASSFSNLTPAQANPLKRTLNNATNWAALRIPGCSRYLTPPPGDPSSLPETVTEWPVHADNLRPTLIAAARQILGPQHQSLTNEVNYGLERLQRDQPGVRPGRVAATLRFARESRWQNPHSLIVDIATRGDGTYLVRIKTRGLPHNTESLSSIFQTPPWRVAISSPIHSTNPSSPDAYTHDEQARRDQRLRQLIHWIETDQLDRAMPDNDPMALVSELASLLDQGPTLPVRIVQRAVDVLGSVMALAALTPLLPIAAAGIRRDSPGPIFYIQTRLTSPSSSTPSPNASDIGTFSMFKLRTMITTAEGPRFNDSGTNNSPSNPTQAQLTIETDPRITRIGSVLRRLRADELPQFWNILRGQMSGFGPRPERQEIAETHQTGDSQNPNKAIIPHFELRVIASIPGVPHTTTVAGLTGLAQASLGYDGTPKPGSRAAQVFAAWNRTSRGLPALALSSTHMADQTALTSDPNNPSNRAQAFTFKLIFDLAGRGAAQLGLPDWLGQQLRVVQRTLKVTSGREGR